MSIAQQASDFAYLIAPNESELRGIYCLDEASFELGYASDAEIGPVFDTAADEEKWEDCNEQARESSHD